MPKLKSYTAPMQGFTTVGGRQASAADFGGEIGAATERLGSTAQNVAGQIRTMQADDEARTALIKSTAIKAKYAAALDEAARTGADTSKLKEQMNNELAAVGTDFSTQRGQESLDLYTSNTNLMFDQQANAIAVKRAAIDAETKGNEWLNNEAAILQMNPYLLPNAEKMAEEFVGTFTSLPPEQRRLMTQKLQQQLNVSAALSVARAHPDEATTRLTSGEWNLTPEQRQYVLKEAEFAGRAARSEAAAARAQKRADESDADQAAANTTLDLIMTGKATKADFFNPSLQPGTRESLLRFQEWWTKERNNGMKPSDPVTKRDLWLRINAPEGSKDKILTLDPIWQAVKDGKLNTTDANMFVSMVQANRDGNGETFRAELGLRMNNISRAISADPTFAGQPDLAAAVQNEMWARVERQAADMRAHGKDPSVLLDPTSEDYFFKPGIIKAVGDDIRRSLAPEITDLRQTDAPDPQTIPDGHSFIDPNGVTRVMTPELKKALRDQAAGDAGRTATGPITVKTTTANYDAAVRDLHLNEQEKALYQRHLDVLKTRPIWNPEGGASTILQIVVEHDGRYYNIPTVWDGKKVPPLEAIKRAKELGWDHWPSYQSEAEADHRYKAMHNYMDRDVPR